MIYSGRVKGIVATLMIAVAFSLFICVVFLGRSRSLSIEVANIIFSLVFVFSINGAVGFLWRSTRGRYNQVVDLVWVLVGYLGMLLALVEYGYVFMNAYRDVYVDSYNIAINSVRDGLRRRSNIECGHEDKIKCADAMNDIRQFDVYGCNYIVNSKIDIELRLACKRAVEIDKEYMADKYSKEENDSSRATQKIGWISGVLSIAVALRLSKSLNELYWHR